MKKTILTLIFVAAMMINCTVYAKSGDDKNEYENIYEKLISFDMADNIDDMNKTITRGEFSKILLRYFNIPVADDYHLTYFTDVAANSQNFAEIMTAYDYGLIFGDENKMFYPDEPIKLQDACVMVVKALGYDEYTEFTSYEQYVSFASNAGITNKVGKNPKEFLDYSNILRLLDNCLDIKILKGIAVLGNKVDLKDCESVLEYVKGIKGYNGVVTANRFSSLASGAEATAENEVGIDGITYDTDIDCDGLLGYNIDFYVNEEDRVVYIEKTNKNNDMTLLKDDVKAFNNDNVEYYINEKEKVKKIKINPRYVFFNDEAISGYGQLTDISWSNGDIKFLDNNNDGIYEAVFFYEYQECIADSINTENGIIFDKINKSQVDLLPEDETVVKIYDENMKITEFPSIKVGDVLNILRTDRNIRVYITRNTVSGEIKQIDAEDMYVVINDMKIKISGECAAMLEQGKEGILYRNKFGIGIFFASQSLIEGYEIGIIKWHNLNENTFEMQEDAYISIFNSDGEFKKYRLDGIVTVNRKRKKLEKREHYTNVSDMLNVGDVIQYKVNGDVVEEINTAYPSSSNEVRTDDIAFRLKTTGSSFYYNDTMLNGEVYMDGRTVIFNTPSDVQNFDGYSIMSNSDLRSGYNYLSPYKAYTVGDNDTFYAVAVVFTDWRCDTYFDNSNIAVVTKCQEVYDEQEGEVRSRLYFMQSTMESEYTLAKGMEEAGNIIKKGDIIRYQVNSKREISRITIIMRNDGLKGQYTDLYIDGNGNFAKSGNGALIYPHEPLSDAVWMAAGQGSNIIRDNDIFYCNFKAVYATVKNISGNYIVYSVNRNVGGKILTKDYIAKANDTSCYTDARDGIKSIGLSDVTAGDTAVIQMYSGTLRRLILVDR